MSKTAVPEMEQPFWQGVSMVYRYEDKIPSLEDLNQR